jgi:hypothetical protein
MKSQQGLPVDDAPLAPAPAHHPIVSERDHSRQPSKP